MTLLLGELSQKQPELPACFKGGTALCKAIGRVKRFSENIDLTVEIQDCSRSQGKKRLETAAKHLYDLAAVLEREHIRRLLSAPAEFVKMLAYKRKEEVRTGRDLAQKPFSEFTLFQAIRDDTGLRDKFMAMQRVYVFSEADIHQPDAMYCRIDQLTQNLLSLNEGLDHSALSMTQPSCDSLCHSPLDGCISLLFDKMHPL